MPLSWLKVSLFNRDMFLDIFFFINIDLVENSKQKTCSNPANTFFAQVIIDLSPFDY